jgi:hypothetical protein
MNFTKLRGRSSMLTLVCMGALALGCGEEPQDLDSAGDIGRVTSALTLSDLALVNGWTSVVPGPWPFPHNGPAVPAVTLVDGVVYLRGGMAGGTTGLAFTLPSAYRPSTTVYLPLSLKGAKKGRLMIETNGKATVVAETDFAAAQAMTSLEGVSYAKTTTGYTALPLINGWTNAPFSTRNAAIKDFGGNGRVVRFAGAIKTTGTNASPFVVPLSMRPSTDVYLPIDLCGGTKGRLRITPAGAVTVVAQGGAWANAQCFTSLEGAWYVKTPASPGSYTCMGAGDLSPWTVAPYSTRNLCFFDDGGIVRFLGALSGGTQPFIVTFGTLMRPGHDVFMEADLCNGEQGQIQVSPDASTSVTAEHGFAQASCFTSLEGVSYIRGN